MLLRLAASAALTAVPCICAHPRSPAVAQRAISVLDDTYARVAQSHHDPHLLQGQRAVLGADAVRAALQPAWGPGVGVEHALGGGEGSDFERAGVTLRLASVREYVGKQNPGQPQHL